MTTLHDGAGSSRHAVARHVFVRSTCMLMLTIAPSCLYAQAVNSALPDTILMWGARLRYTLPDEAEPRFATVGQIGECLVALYRVGQTWSRVPLDRLVRLEVSKRYDGTPGPDGSPRVHVDASNDTVGEGWRTLDVAAIRRRYGKCPPRSVSARLDAGAPRPCWRRPSILLAHSSAVGYRSIRRPAPARAQPTATATSRSSAPGSSAGTRTARPDL